MFFFFVFVFYPCYLCYNRQTLSIPISKTFMHTMKGGFVRVMYTDFD